MRTGPEPLPAVAAASEAGVWLELAALAHVDATWADVAPTELAVTGHDPTGDLHRRASDWSHVLPDASLATLARFGAGLASAESAAWEEDHPELATRAYEARRFLLGDRLIHWAVPWLDAVGRCYPGERERAHAARDTLLRIGDDLRPAPLLVDGGEGLFPPGEDSLGPLDAASLDRLGAGLVVLRATVRSVTGDAARLRPVDVTDVDGSDREYFALLFEVAAARWRTTAATHPGSAMLWRDLARRADRTAARIADARG